MKYITMLCASMLALAALLPTAPGAAADEQKNISDGAAKGQASEGVFHPQKHGKPGAATKRTGHGQSRSHMAVKSSGVPQNSKTVHPRPTGKSTDQPNPQ